MPATAPLVAPDTAHLLVSCPDQPGIIAAVSGLLRARGINIIQSDQYSTDPVGGDFYLRMVLHVPEIAAQLESLRADLEAEVAEARNMTFVLSDAAQPKRIALMVSRYDHCLLDLLWRWRRGELNLDVGAVVSNWPDLESEVERFGVPYHHVPVTRDTKAQAEAQQLELIDEGRFDLVVLARYMQVLSTDFLRRAGCPIINIHHSFLPAFAGAGPYERAKARGRQADRRDRALRHRGARRGPDHRAGRHPRHPSRDRSELMRLGADVERTVLASARCAGTARTACIVYGDNTVVF